MKSSLASAARSRSASTFERAYAVSGFSGESSVALPSAAP